MKRAFAYLTVFCCLISSAYAFDGPPNFAIAPSGFSVGDISDVDTSSAVANDILLYDGANWSAWTPAYGSLEFATSTASTAASNAVYNGTVAAGTVVNTTTIDGVYLQVTESGQFLIDFTFPLGTNVPAAVDIVGRYEGNPAHNVKAKAWDYTNSEWDDLTAETNDFVSNTTDEDFRFSFPNLTDYLSGGNAIVRIDHESASVGTHNMYIDFIQVETVGVSMPTAGDFYLVNAVTAGASLNTTLDTSAGSITVGPAGDYLSSVSMSFTGKSEAVYHIHVFVNGVEQYKTGIAQSIPSSTNVDSAHGNGILSLSAGDVLTVKVRSEIDNSYLILDHFVFTVHRLVGN